MGFSFKKVFRKNEGNQEAVPEGNRGSIFRSPGATEAPSDQLGGSVPSLAPPPLSGQFDSPFQTSPSPGDPATLSPFDGGGMAGGAGLTPTTVAGIPNSIPELPAFDGRGEPAQSFFGEAAEPPSPFDGHPGASDPAAAPLPTRHDSESSKDLESKGFRPLSSLLQPGDVPPATPPMDQPSNDSSSTQRPAQPIAGGARSPFEVDGMRMAPFGSEPIPPVSPRSPFEIAPPTAPEAPAWQEQAPAAPPLSASPFEQYRGGHASPFESVSPAQAPRPSQAPVSSGSIPPTVTDHAPMPGMAAPVEVVSMDEGSELPLGALEDPREFVEMNVVQLLSGVAPAALGVAEVTISPFAKTRIPMAILRPQLPTGQVFLNVSDLIVGCSPEHRAGMVGYNPTVRIRVPIGLIFPTVGAEVSTAAEQAPAADSFGQQTPAPIEAQPPAVEASQFFQEPVGLQPSANGGLALPGLDGGLSLPPQNPAPEAEQLPLFPPAAEAEISPSLPPAVAPDPVVAAPEPASAPSFGSPLAALAPLGGGLGATPVEPPSSGVTQGSEPPLPPMMPASGGLAPTAFDTPNTPQPEVERPKSAENLDNEGGWPFDPTPGAASPPSAGEAVGSLEDLPAIDATGAFEPVEGFNGVSSGGSGVQSTLQALFLKGDTIDADAVVSHFDGLEGIENSVVLGRSGKIVSSSSGFAQQASKLLANLTELTSAAGVAESDHFTIRTDDAMVSFFSGDGFAIGVKHDPQGFRPGVRERLALAAKELGSLAG